MDRIRYLDTARGIAIFLVVLGHCIGSVDNPVNKVILSFHMPLFFLISGILLNENVIPKSHIKKWFVKKCKHLLLPQLTLGLFECIFIFIHNFYETHTLIMLSFSDIIHAVMKWWFLLVFFQVTLFSLLLKNFILPRKKFLFFIILILFLFILLQQFGLITLAKIPFFLNIFPVALMFYILGYFSKKIFANIRSCLIPLAFFCVIVVSLFNEPVLMYKNSYGNFILFFITSILGAYSVIGFAQLFHLSFFHWLGKVSIIIYVLQFHINQYCSPIATLMLGVFFQNDIDENLYSCMYICIRTIFSLSICSILAYYISRYNFLGLMFGANKRE